ncbi:Autophagy-related protein [Dirofilaria immitis]
MKSLLVLLFVLLAIETVQSYGWAQRSFGGGNFGSGTFNSRNAGLYSSRSLGGYGGNPNGYGGNYGGYGRGPYGAARRAQFGAGIPMHGGLVGKKK